MDEKEAEQHARISELSKQGYQLLKEGLIRRAIENFEKIILLEPENNYALVGLGDALRKKKDYSKAAEYYLKCLNYHAGNNYALFGLADCYKAMGQFNRAIEIWEEYLELDAENITVLTRVADAYRKVRDFEKSRKLYLKVLDKDRRNSYALIGLGHLHYDFREYDKALDFWKEMEIQGGSVIDIRVLTSIGNCYRKLKDFSHGISYFERALKKQSDNFYALYGLADCYRGLNRPEDSLECWVHILDNDPDNRMILTRAGDACRNLGNLDKGAEYYKKALEIDYDLYAELGLALISKTLGNPESALKRLRVLVEKEPGNSRIYVEAAECLEKLGRREKALELLNSFQGKDGTDRQIRDYTASLEKTD